MHRQKTNLRSEGSAKRIKGCRIRTLDRLVASHLCLTTRPLTSQLKVAERESSKDKIIQPGKNSGLGSLLFPEFGVEVRRKSEFRRIGLGHSGSLSGHRNRNFPAPGKYRRAENPSEVLPFGLDGFWKKLIFVGVKKFCYLLFFH